MITSSFSEDALRKFNELALERYGERKVQGMECHDNNPPIKSPTRKVKGGPQGREFTDVADAMEDEVDERIEYSQPRCEAGFWRYPAETGICTPREAVKAQMRQEEKDRLNEALRNRLQSLKKSQMHRSNTAEKKKPVVVNKVVERKSPTVKIEQETIYGILLPDGKFDILNK